jgi:TRAP-type mannitol/chloroaromatic compound transport system permease large subunit
MGATGALILALAKRRLSWPLLRQAMDSTAKLSSFVMFILIGSSVFTLTFRGVNGDLWVESLLTGLPGGQIGFLVFVNAMVFVRSCWRFSSTTSSWRSSSSRCCARSPTSSASI